MSQMKEKLKRIGAWIWDIVKNSLPALVMYVMAGTILMMLTMKADESIDKEEALRITWDNKKLLWTLVCCIGAAAYNGLLTWACGGNQYEMLVSGNLKRVSASYGEGFKISSHKEAKEYRAWKGFAIGAVISLLTLIVGILFGCNQAAINSLKPSKGVGAIMLVGFFLSGWSVLPLYYLNMSGIAVNYFLSCLFALLPIIVSGVFYIAGAYARRAKSIRQQELADKAAAADAAKVKKINYGGLPGTKPKKRK